VLNLVPLAQHTVVSSRSFRAEACATISSVSLGDLFTPESITAHKFKIYQCFVKDLTYYRVCPKCIFSSCNPMLCALLVHTVFVLMHHQDIDDNSPKLLGPKNTDPKFIIALMTSVPTP
jgi:hypothetical protein